MQFFQIIFSSGIFLLTFVVVNIIFALAVHRDSERLVREGGSTDFLSPRMWMLVVLCGGTLPALFYWLVHYSNLKADTGPSLPD